MGREGRSSTLRQPEADHRRAVRTSRGAQDAGALGVVEPVCPTRDDEARREALDVSLPGGARHGLYAARPDRGERRRAGAAVASAAGRAVEEDAGARGNV